MVARNGVNAEIGVFYNKIIKVERTRIRIYSQRRMIVIRPICAAADFAQIYSLAPVGGIFQVFLVAVFAYSGGNTRYAVR